MRDLEHKYGPFVGEFVQAMFNAGDLVRVPQTESGAMIRRCRAGDFNVMLQIINDAAHAYKGVIPEDCWREPYMPEQELREAIERGVEFWGIERAGELVGMMGLQRVQDVELIRHAYVRTEHRRNGLGSRLLCYLLTLTRLPCLVGTWEAATWAEHFYEKHGFRLVSTAEKDRLLPKYWRVSPRQIETSVVLANERWILRNAALEPTR